MRNQLVFCLESKSIRQVRFIEAGVYYGVEELVVEMVRQDDDLLLFVILLQFAHIFEATEGIFIWTVAAYFCLVPQNFASDYECLGTGSHGGVHAPIFVKTWCIRRLVDDKVAVRGITIYQ